MDHTLTLPRPSTTSSAAEEPARRPGLLGRLGRATAYVVSGFVLGVVGFSVVLVGLTAGVGLLVVWVGLAVLVGTVLVARGLARLERHRLVVLQGRDVPAPSYAVAPDGAGALRRFLTPLRDPQS
ncbi:MAG: sensor histidine kinase [Nocardioides sp.]|nr:sensor histidine kinase [Nocardioides sp.]